MFDWNALYVLCIAQSSQEVSHMRNKINLNCGCFAINANHSKHNRIIGSFQTIEYLCDFSISYLFGVCVYSVFYSTQ